MDVRQVGFYWIFYIKQTKRLILGFIDETSVPESCLWIERRQLIFVTSSLRDFLTVLFKDKNKTLIIFSPGAATATIGSFLSPPSYEAKSSMFIKVGRENTDWGLSIPEDAERHLGLPVLGAVSL